MWIHSVLQKDCLGAFIDELQVKIDSNVCVQEGPLAGAPQSTCLPGRTSWRRCGPGGRRCPPSCCSLALGDGFAVFVAGPTGLLVLETLKPGLEGPGSAVKEGRGCQDHARYREADPGSVARFTKFPIPGFLCLSRNLPDSQRLHFRFRDRPLQSTWVPVTELCPGRIPGTLAQRQAGVGWL